MKIIQEGKTPNFELRFECDNCGCIFEANCSEYALPNYFESVHDGIKAKCLCPFCNQIIYKMNDED